MPMQRYIDNSMDLERACDQVGGRFFEPNEDIFVCEVNDDEVVLHEYMAGQDGSVVVRGDTEWTGRSTDLYQTNDGIELQDAEGNPGPPGPMHVSDATVTLDRVGVRAERTQQF